MTDQAKPQRRSFLMGGFSRISTEADARGLAKAGGVAGFLLTLSEAVGAVMRYYGIDATTFKSVTKGDIHSPAFVIEAAVDGVLIALLLLGSWRTFVGKGYVSGVLLAILLAFEGCSKVLGGTLNIGWAIVYVGLFVSLIGAVRSAWYLGKARKMVSQAKIF